MSNWRHPSLTWRLAAVLVVIVLLAQIGVIMIARYATKQFTNQQLVTGSMLYVSALRRAIIAGDAEAEREMRALLDERGIQLQRGDAGVPPKGLAAPGLIKLRDDIRTALGDDMELRVSVLPEPRAWLGFTARSERYWLHLSLVIASPNLPRPAVIWLLLLAFLSSAGVVFFIWQINRPLDRLAKAINSQQESLQPISVTRHAPREVAAIGEAFNALAGRIDRHEQERSTLLAGVSHDLRSPLARMRVRAEGIEDATTRERMIADVESIDRIVDHFIAYASEAPANPSVNRDITPELGALLERYREVGHDVQLLNTDPCVTVIDAIAVERIVTNLTDNALEYGATPVRVKVASADGAFSIEVSDAGEGMSEQQFARAKKPFVRLDTSRGGSGHSGLGLAIVARIVERRGGAFSAHREDGRFVIRATLPGG